MSTYESKQELIAEANRLFRDSDLLPIQIDLVDPYPRCYLVYDIGTAAIAALSATGLSAEEIASQDDLQHEIVQSVKTISPDWDELLQRREKLALALNNYGGPGREFNLN